MPKIPLTIQPPINIGGTPETYLRQKDFDALIYRRGYNVYLDKMMPCPCKEKGMNSAKLSCKNCFGTGFILSERIQTKAMIAQQNYPTNYKDWSIENIGTAQITTLSRNPVSFMDRIILYEEINQYSELIYPITLDSGDIIAFCAYPPIDILNMKLFEGDDSPLLDIDTSLIEVDEEGKLILNKIKDSLYKRTNYTYSEDSAISIRYTYHPSYHIIDVMRNLLTSTTDTPTVLSGDKISRVNFPYSSMGRFSHLVLERGNLISLPNKFNLNTNSQKSTSMYDQMNDKNTSEEFANTENK